MFLATRLPLLSSTVTAETDLSHTRTQNMFLYETATSQRNKLRMLRRSAQLAASMVSQVHAALAHYPVVD
jgi:hypothetical protein